MGKRSRRRAGRLDREQPAILESAVRRLVLGLVLAFTLTSATGSASTASPQRLDQTEPEATSQQECIRDALTPVHIEKSLMTKAGRPGAQRLYARWVNDELPSNCESQFDIMREERFNFTVQSPTHRTRWIPFKGQRLSENRALSYTGHEGGFHAVYDTSEGKHDWGLYRCTKGPKTTGARVQIEKVAVNTQDQGELAHKVFRSPIQKIFPKRC